MDIVMISTVGGLAVAAAGMGFMFRELRRAPAGREDAQGFHFGHEPLPVSAAPDLPVAANSNAANVLDLSPDQCAVLAELEGEIAVPAAKLVAYTGLSRQTVTRVRKELRAMGLADYGYLRDDGIGSEIAGRGYWLTGAGLEAQAKLRGHKQVAA